MSAHARIALLTAAIASGPWPNAALSQTALPPAATAPAAGAATTTGQDAPTTSQPPPAGILEQEALTGDWGGARTRWRDKGIVLDSSLTQRYNLLDSLDEDFFAGNGTDRFFNIAQIGPLTVLRQVPLITNAVNLAYIRGGEPFFTFSVLDPNDRSLEPGLSDLFADGVTFSPGMTFPATYGGKTARHSFGAAITTKKYTPFDAIRQAIVPGPPLVPVEPQRGSWSVNYVFRQYIVERAARDGWGLFTQVSFADRATSPITTFFDVGLGGNGLFAARPRDEFGIAYAYTDLSEDLKDNLDLPIVGLERLRAEHQLELFYNVHVAPWLQLTGDLQIIRPNHPLADPAIVPGARLRIDF